MLNLVNDSDLEAALIPGWNRQGQRQHTLVIKATYDFNLSGEITLASQQRPLAMVEQWRDKPRLSSLTAADETAPFKQGAEYYLFGSACPVGDRTATRISVSLEDGTRRNQKALRVCGEHHWVPSWKGVQSSRPEPLATATPLHYELAYGGVADKHRQQVAANPAGRGFNPSRFTLHDDRAPLIEYDRGIPAVTPHQPVQPAGFGPLPASWEPRSKRTGTIGHPNHEEGCPWGSNAPENLHNCAPDDQQWPLPFWGDETLTLQGFFPDHGAPVTLALPVQSLQPQLIDAGDSRLLAPQCDTLVIDTDQQQLSLIWRCALLWHSPLEPQPISLWLPPTLRKIDSAQPSLATPAGRQTREQQP